MRNKLQRGFGKQMIISNYLHKKTAPVKKAVSLNIKNDYCLINLSLNIKSFIMIFKTYVPEATLEGTLIEAVVP